MNDRRSLNEDNLLWALKFMADYEVKHGLKIFKTKDVILSKEDFYRAMKVLEKANVHGPYKAIISP